MDSADQALISLPDKPLRSLGRDEMNLAEFPITLLTDRVPKNQTQAVYQDEIFDEKSGLTLSRKLTISAGNYGLTTPADDEVILSLIQLTKQKNNFTNRRLEFSRYELVQLLGWNVGGISYDRILQSLQRWTSVFLQYENAWRDNRSKTWRTVGFHIIDKFELTDTRMSDDQLDLLPSYIMWGEDIFESFQAGYLKPLDYDLCMGLKNSTAKRMYRFLDKRFYHKTELEFELKEFAHEHIGLGRHYEGPAHLIRNLLPAISELERIAFLEPMPRGERFQKNGKEYKIRLVRKPEANANASAHGASSEQPPVDLLTLELVRRGVKDSVAEELVKVHSADLVTQQIQVFDWLIATKNKKVKTSPAGYLVKSISDDYATPKGFVSNAQLQREAEAKKNREQKEAAERLLKNEADAHGRREKQLINGFWDSLSDEQKAEHEAIAIAQADDNELKLIATGAMKKFGMTVIRQTYARKLLQSQGKLAPTDA